MGLFGFVKSAFDTVTSPIAAAGGYLGAAGGFLLDGAGQMAFHLGEDAVHIATFGQVGSWANPFSFNTKQLFLSSALGSKLGEFASGFTAKLVLGGGPVALGASLLFGGLNFSNPVADKLVNPGLMFEAKELGLMSGAAAGQQAQQIPAVCGPEGKGPDGNTYQAVAIPLPPGATPTGPTQTDPKTGQVYELALVPPGSCKDNVVTITPQEIAKTQGMANAIAGSSNQSGSSSAPATNGSGN